MNVMTECLTPLSLLINWMQHNPSCTEVYHSSIATDASTFWEYVSVFAMTYILELPIYFLFLRTQSYLHRVLLINLIVNLATHPIVYLVMPIIFQKWELNYLQYLLIAEVFAPVVEAALLIKLFHIDKKTAIQAAILANLFSWTIGVYWIS